MSQCQYCKKELSGNKTICSNCSKKLQVAHKFVKLCKVIKKECEEIQKAKIEEKVKANEKAKTK